MSGKIVLDVRNISVSFSRYVSAFKKARPLAVRDLSVAVREGEMVAVVGASGSGKSLLAHAILGILPYNAIFSGEMFYLGEKLTPKRARKLRGNGIALVPQSVSYLDPLMKVGSQIRNGDNDGETRAKSEATLKSYGLSENTGELYPFELSGGMARRILISTAVLKPQKLIIADEPTPGLPAHTARRVIGHFREIAETGAGVLLITHDLELAADMADRIVVFYAGMALEDAPASDFTEIEKLRHPYTRALWRAMPRNGFEAAEIPVQNGGGFGGPGGCLFAGSCGMASKKCGDKVPYMEAGGGYVRCAKGGYCDING